MRGMPKRLCSWLPLLHRRLNSAALAGPIVCAPSAVSASLLVAQAQARRQARTCSFCCFLPSSPARSAGLTLVFSVNLPQINDLERYRPSTMTDLYDRKGRIIGSFALERRDGGRATTISRPCCARLSSPSKTRTSSPIGASTFFASPAPLWHDIRSHGRAQGASTLTMQLARNLFLSSDRTATRKIQEAYLAIQIERAFTKEQIFTLYGNQIYLGSGMYGFEAASEYLLQQARQGPEPDRSGAAGGAAEGARGLFAPPQS